ncbi:unnamed protein product, partial [Musa acuminata subsp. burmannicoides]
MATAYLSPIPTSEPSNRASQVGSTVWMLNSNVFTRIPSSPLTGPPNHHLQASLPRDPAGM